MMPRERVSPTVRRERRNRQQVYGRNSQSTEHPRELRFIQNANSPIYDADEPIYTIGPMNFVCDFCNALHFKDEEINNYYQMCCHNGKVSLNLFAPHAALRDLLNSSRNFRENIRAYNNALAFGSLTTEFPDVALGQGPPILRIHGAIYRNIGSLHPNEGERPKFAQLYIIDTSQALQERMGNIYNSNCNPEIMQALHDLLIHSNPYAQLFLQMKDLEDRETLSAFNEGRPVQEVRMFLVRNSTDDVRRYNLPTASNEIAAVFTTGDGEPPNPQERDIVIYCRMSQSCSRINILSKHADSLLYPLLFPYGNPGWHPGIAHVSSNRTAQRNQTTLAQFYCYHLSIRSNFNFLHGSQKLFQQYVIDAYLKVEGNRLNYIRNNQSALRVESYRGLLDHMANSAANQGLQPGRIVILPSSFSGSPRNMHQHYQDAMAIVRKYGKPHYFITFTCNPSWPENENVSKK